MGQFTEEQLRTAQGFLTRVVTDKAVKLKWGSMKRLSLAEELTSRSAEGRMASGHYRLEWIRDVQDEIVQVLSRQAVRFNRTWKHDCISVRDMADTLLTVLNRLSD